ncbi:MAG: fluoride efflux transporter CrcB [Marmoricola sp.]
MTVLTWCGIAVLGGLGAVARFTLDTAIVRRTTSAFPVGILTVNVTGAFLLGLLTGLALPDDVALVLGTGFVGAYTTFSTWMLQTRMLLEERHVVVPVLNVALSVVLGLLAAWAGLQVGG